MSPWGLDGGGPLNDQQVDTLLAYIKSIQIEREDCGAGEDDPLLCDSGHLPAEDQADIDELARRAVEDGEYASYGEALFNLDLSSGAYSCARCHTPGWSWGDPGVPGQGAFGWNLTDGAVDTHFPNEDDMVDFIKTGSELGAKYGTQGQGSGRMPGFGQHAHRRADQRHRRLRAEPLDECVAGHHLGARAPRHPDRHHRRRSRCAAASTWSSAPTSAPGSASSWRSPGWPGGWR